MNGENLIITVRMHAYLSNYDFSYLFIYIFIIFKLIWNNGRTCYLVGITRTVAQQ